MDTEETRVETPAAGHRQWTALAATAVAVLGGLALWLGRTPELALREQLLRWQFWALEVLFLAVVATTVLALPALVRALALGRRTLVQLAAIVVLGLGLAAFVAPRTNRIFYDEQIYQGIGQNLTDLKLAQMCNDGTVEYGRLQCWRGEYNKQPYGYPYLLSVAYRLVGVHDGVAQVVNNVAMGLFALAVFAGTALLFASTEAGLLAALVAVSIPHHLLWSNTAACEPTAALFAAIAVVATVSFVRERSTRALAWCVATTAFAAQFRTESLLIVVVVAVIVLLFATDELRRPRLWWAALAGLLLCAALLGHLAAVRGESWGSTGTKLSLAFLRPNLAVNGGFFLVNQRFPALATLLALVALAGRPRRREALATVVWFVAFFAAYLLFYAGSFDFGADVRFSLLLSAPIAVLAGRGAATVVGWLRQVEALRPWAGKAVVATLAVSLLSFMPLVRAVGEEAWGARADVAYAREIVRELPPNSVILTHNPHMFHLWGVSAAQASLATTDEPWARGVLPRRYAGGVYFHFNFWCNVDDPLQVSFCTNLLDRFANTLVSERHVRDSRFALFKLDLPTHRF